MLRYLIMYLYKKKNGKKFDFKIARYRGLPYSGWTYQSETTLLSCLNSSDFKCLRIYVEQMLSRICSAFKLKRSIYREFTRI